MENDNGEYEQRHVVVHPNGEIELDGEMGKTQDYNNSPIAEQYDEDASTPMRPYQDDELIKITREVKKKD